MSPRLKKSRKVLAPPPVKGFKPYGGEASEGSNAETVFLHFEEYEALRLCDYDMYNHHEASVMMGVSRPTFTRIYAAARQKIAISFVEGRPVAIEGGKVYFDSDWYHCAGCGSYFNNPAKETTPGHCPLCSSNQIEGYDIEPDCNHLESGQCEDLCVCPVCGFEKEHRPGNPCSREVCPECNSRMRRKGSAQFGKKRKRGR